jgi:peptidoglycan/LPS O-acetylase OafA/YrhL
MISKTGSVAWPILIVLTLILLADRVRRRQPVALETALVLVAAAVLAMNVQTGFFESRYYLPTLGLMAIAFSLVTADIGPRSAVAAVWIVLVCAGFFLPTTFSWVSQWAELERGGGELLLAVSGLDAKGCRVRITGLDPERTLALPALVRLRKRPLERSCADGRTYLVEGSDAPDQRLVSACAPARKTLGTWALTAGEIVSLRACR